VLIFTDKSGTLFRQKIRKVEPMRVSSALASCALLGLLGLASQAQAVVIVIGGGPGTECYATAEFGDPFQAFDICTRALRQENMSVRDRAATYVNRSVIRLRVKDYNGAIDDTDLSIARAPNIGEAYVNRGAAYLNLNRPQEALENLNKAIDLGLDKVYLAYYNRALTKERLNDVRGAYADLLKTVELNPTFTMAQDELKRYTVNGMAARS
jgi:tetratricopeptide (TPR) repeat protein